MQRLMRLMVVFVVLVTLLSACGGSATTSSTSVRNAGGAATTSGARSEAEAPAAQPAAADEAQAGSGANANSNQTDKSKQQNVTFANDPNRKIIKNGDVTLEVESVTVTTSRITAIAAGSGGYVIETKNANGDGQANSASIVFAVPVDRFETALDDVRKSGKRVVSEQASGQDVSQDYVDLQNQIANLEATQGRVRLFLDQAKTVGEALEVNKQLTELDGQISQAKGRLQFLSQRAAFSTITVQLQQIAGPAPTPTAIPVKPWQASATVNAATSALQSVLQGVANVAIWLGIVVVPLLVPVVLLWLLARSLRRRTRRTVIAPRADDSAA